MMKILQSWDDGVIDDVRVLEILRKYNAKGTFNLNPGLYKTDRTFGWMHDSKEVWRLGTDEMKKLYDGFEIASHSMTHPYLTQCLDDELIYEVIESRKFLQNFFQQEISGFCYPFGDFDDRVKRVMREAGYTHARGINRADNKIPVADAYELNPHCHFADKKFWNYFNEALEVNAEYFFFWGHSYEIFTDEIYCDLEDKVCKISKYDDCEWCNTSDLF